MKKLTQSIQLNLITNEFNSMSHVHLCVYSKKPNVIFPLEKEDFKYKGNDPLVETLLDVDPDFKFNEGNCVLTQKGGGFKVERVFTCANTAREYAQQQGWKLGDEVYIESVVSTTREIDKCSQSGVWFLSYLCSKGFIEHHDDICGDCVDGILKKQLPGTFETIPVGSEVFVRFDACRDKMTVFWRDHKKTVETFGSSESDDEVTRKETPNSESDEDDDDECWWEAPGANKLEGTLFLDFD